MSSKKGVFITLLIIVLGVALAYFVITLVLDVNGKINQGSCRFIDVVTTSILDVEDNSKELENLQETTDLKLTINQRNSIDMILGPESNIKQAYISGISIVSPTKVGNMVIYQADKEEKRLINEIKENYDIEPVIENNEFKIHLNIDNEELLKEVSMPEGMDFLKIDGRVLKDYKLLLEDVKFTVKFNLNVVDNMDKTSTSKIEFEFPTEKFINDGIDITQRSLEGFVFKAN